MTEPEEAKLRRRRTRQELQRLVSEFGTSGLARSEFCRIQGMTLSTLHRGLERERIESGGSQSNDKRLVVNFQKSITPNSCPSTANRSSSI
jgi:hypothetical protein